MPDESSMPTRPALGLVERVVAPYDARREVETRTSLLAAGAQAVRSQKALMQRWAKLPHR